MSTHILRRGVSALGISLAVAIVAIAPASFAQPQPLPGSQYQTPAPPPYQAAPPQYQGQQYPYAQPQYGQPDGYGSRRPYDARERRGDENRIDRRVAMLHQRLAITPAQEGAWSQFVAEMRNMATGMERAFERGRDERRPMNAVERLEQRERMLGERQAGLDRMVRALRPLYASFSDEQKRTADQLLFRAERGPGFAGAPGGRYGGPGFSPRTPG